MVKPRSLLRFAEDNGVDVITAINYAVAHGLALNVYATDEDGPQANVSADVAAEYANVDPSLVTVSPRVWPRDHTRWTPPMNLGGSDYVSYLRGSEYGVMWTDFGLTVTIVADDGNGRADVIDEYGDLYDAVRRAERMA